MPYNAQLVGDRIHTERVLRRMSKKELGDVIGVSENTIGNYESGKTSPDLDKAWALADLFNLPLDAMFGRKSVA